MAKIRNCVTGEIVILKAQHIFGRNSSSSTTCIHETDVSQLHAKIFWGGENWIIQDCSRNGTIVNKEYIHHQTQQLNMDSKVQFGKNEITNWEMVCDDKPSSYLQNCNDPTKIIELENGLVISNSTNPEILFYYSNEGEWKAELKDKIIELTNNQLIYFNEENWIFIQNEILDETIDYGKIVHQAYFQFELSCDEEHIKIKIINNDFELNLGSRAHNYLLLSLARKRLEDTKLNLSEDELGWIDLDDVTNDVSKELRKEVDMYYLNLQIHRLRKQLIELKPYGYRFSNVIERRNGEIRFSYPYLKIIKNVEIAGEILAVN